MAKKNWKFWKLRAAGAWLSVLVVAVLLPIQEFRAQEFGKQSWQEERVGQLARAELASPAKQSLVLRTAPKAAEFELLAQLPIVPQEMRGTWLVTVHNIDWPSQPGAAVEQQQAELLGLLDRAQNLGLNTVVFQIRSVADALYPSALEPWSAFLTGFQGRAPEPLWDPLAFAIAAAHKRGLELHAWLNPYRVGYLKQRRFDSRHIFRQRPDLVRLYGDSYWLDPGNPDSEQYILQVLQDIITRYQELDGIHYDDYFYPYPKSGLRFRDGVTQKAYAAEQPLADWRRENIDQVVAKSYRLIKDTNPYISFGISPFGIWRNDQPKGVRGLESYRELYADSRKWLQNGWVDYLAPQFYWAPNASRQPYDKMLHWWLQQNTNQRQLVAGVNIAKLKEDGNVDFGEILQKISLRREYRGHGEIYYSLGKVNTAQWQTDLRSLYPYQALPPLVGPNRPPLPPPAIELALNTGAQKKPKERPPSNTTSWQLSWKPNHSRKVSYWVLYYQRQGLWQYRIYPAWVRGIAVKTQQDLDPRYFAVAAVDRGNAIGNVSWFGAIPADQVAQNHLPPNENEAETAEKKLPEEQKKLLEPAH